MPNPYVGKPDTQFWRRSVSGRGPKDVDPVVRPVFRIGREDRVATAGSCFAQHIARTLRDSGFGYFLTEDAPALPFSGADNYGTFSARFGNIYTVRQLLQLYQRAYGLYEPADTAWPRSDGRYVDPFRPRIVSDGFASVDEVLREREVHFEAVRRMFEECDVFIFTLGLTEAWTAPDGAVVPLAPGVVAELANAEAYEFKNFTVAEMDTDLSLFLDALRRINPSCRVMLTVSPVALIATYEDRHVLTATTYSKAVLRVVAEQATRRYADVDYFPSYEIITGPQARTSFYEDDLREVRPEGVAHVMRIFRMHYLGNEPASQHRPVSSPTFAAPLLDQAALIREVQGVICDEEQIERSL
jgi:hypothetical protein